MVWEKTPGGTQYCRVRDLDGRVRAVSCETTDRAVAKDMERCAKKLRAKREGRLLAAILDGREGFTLPRVYDAVEAGTLDRLRDALDDVDLSPLVAEWHGRGRRTRSDKYETQVRRLIPEGVPFLRSRFTRGTVSAFLSGLDVDGPTKNTYKAALMQFGHWLVEREVIPGNPVRDVQGFPVNAPRMVFFEPDVARAIVEAITDPTVRAMHALMASSAVEWAACMRATRRDLHLELGRFHAHGTKNQYRERWVEIAPAPVHEAFAWALPIVRAYALPLAPSARLFPLTDERSALKPLRAALTAVGLPRDATQHDWRHTFAVAFRRRHGDPAVAKRQLGHAPTSMVYEKVYSVYTDELPEPTAPDCATALHLVREG